jgi:Acetyltransferase (GNAT) family
MTELRLAGPEDRDAVAAFLHERMSSRIGLERWRRLFDYPWLEDKPDCGVVVSENGGITGYLGVVHAERWIGERPVRTANLSSWYVARSLRGRGVGLAMLELATRDPGVTYTTFSSNPPALRLMAKVGLGVLDERRLLWRRTGDPSGTLVLSGLDAVLPEVLGPERQILQDHRELAVHPHLLRAPEGDCLVILAVKKKGEDVDYHEVLHLGRPAVFARRAQAFANLVLAPGASVLAVDMRFLDGFTVAAETEPIGVPRFFRSPGLARREVDFLYSEIPLLDLKLY